MHGRTSLGAYGARMSLFTMSVAVPVTVVLL
jgi:hypothetical protein